MDRFDLWLKEHSMTLAEFNRKSALRKVAEKHHELLKSLEDK